MNTQAAFAAGVQRLSQGSRLIEERSTKQDAWERFVDSHICAFSYRAQATSAFSVEARARSVQPFGVVRLITSAGPAELQRGGLDIARDNKTCYAFYLPTRGYQEIHQFHRIQRCQANGLIVVSTSEPFLQLKPGDNDTTCLLVGSDFVDRRALHFEDLCARVIDASSGLPRLFQDSLIALERESCNMSAEHFFSAIQAVSELAILAVASHTTPYSDCSSLRACNLAKVKRIIRRRFMEPTLTLLDVATECKLSLRYLHKLFHQEGRSMSEYLTNERLQHARILLQQASADATVTDVCFASGFSNTSRFSTAFKRAFGVPPREVLRCRVSGRYIERL